MDLGGSSTIMETSTRVIGRTTRLVVSVNLSLATVQSMSGSGTTTSSMAVAKKLGLTTQFTLVSTPKEKSMDVALSNGLMDQSTRASFSTTTSKVQVSMSGPMVVATKEIGSLIECMEAANSIFQTVASTKVNTKKTRKMATESSFGQMVASIKENG